MKIRLKCMLWLLLVFSLITFSFLYFFVVYASTMKQTAIARNYSKSEAIFAEHEDIITVVIVVCGERSEEALVLLKSAVIFQGSSQLNFIILCDTDLQLQLDSALQQMKLVSGNSFSYLLMNISFPDHKTKEWRTLFKPCSAQRLFLPNILTNVSNILYVDTDVIFLNELSDIWSQVRSMNSSQMAALVLEHEDPNISWYSRFARHPFYGNLGVNSAVMFMNLTKMREFKWVEYMDPLLTKFKLNLSWGDQDLINIIFHYHPDKLYLFPCRFNYRGDHCMYKSICKDAELNGVSVIHGSRGVFHTDKQRALRAVYHSFSQYVLGTDLYENLLQPLKRNLEETKDTNCGKLMDIFTKNVARLVDKRITIKNL